MASWRNHHILLTLWNSCEREWKRKREGDSSLNSNAICIENVYEKRRRRGCSSRSSIIRRGAKCSHTSVMNTCYDNNQCDRSINNNYFHFIFRCNAYKVWLVFFVLFGHHRTGTAIHIDSTVYALAGRQVYRTNCTTLVLMLSFSFATCAPIVLQHRHCHRRRHHHHHNWMPSPFSMCLRKDQEQGDNDE